MWLLLLLLLVVWPHHVTADYVPQTGLFSVAMTPPPSAVATGFSTWVNQGSATEVDTPIGMSFTMPSQNNTHSVNGLVKVAPAVPYTVTVLLIWGSTPIQFYDSNALIGWYDGANGIDVVALNPYVGTLSYSHNTYASYNAAVNAPTPSDSCSLKDIARFGTCSYPMMQPIMPPTPSLWVQLANDGVTASVATSLDGANYQVLWSFPVAGGFLAAGYNDLLIGGDAHLAQAAFTIASYSQGFCALPSQMVFTTRCNSAMQSLI